jgi:hypothetical protein
MLGQSLVLQRDEVFEAGGARTMPKAVKGLAGRKPPLPSAEHSHLDEWFGLLVPHLQPIVKELDASIRALVPNLHYAVKWKGPSTGYRHLDGSSR